MTDLTADEMLDRIQRSLKESSAEFAKKRHAERNARIRQAIVICLVFAMGVAVGALVINFG
jgi:F0F1-type ATP synthase assembly protein I